MDYIDVLEAVETSSAPYVNCPLQPEV
ncbi:hypothetical protein [Enterobacter roggenkampii]